ncbi:MAG: hypothetical protein WAK95_06475, partial [Desulfobacterales bacterium]
FEEERGTPILGMMTHAAGEGALPAGSVFVSHGPTPQDAPAFTASTTHGGFDNDPVTMNHLLRRVLGGPPKQPFTQAALIY